MMNFNIKGVSSINSVKKERFFLFRFSEIISQIFLFLFILSLLFLVISFVGYFPSKLAQKFLELSLLLFFVFWDISLFTNLKIKSDMM